MWIHARAHTKRNGLYILRCSAIDITVHEDIFVEEEKYSYHITYLFRSTTYDRIV